MIQPARKCVSVPVADKVIPKIVQIEPIFGCNASCVMCVIDMPTKRKKGVMSMSLFKRIVDDLHPYRDQIRQIDLFGLGEPLLDKNIFERIRYLKKMEMQGVGISTNADLLNEKRQDLLLESGLDAVIFSIDSMEKEVHEKIRKGTNFDRVLANANSLIRKRDEGNFSTKFIFRFIRQEANRNGWKDFKSYWDARIDRNKGDQINLYQVHNWVGEANVEMAERTREIEELECYQVFDRMFILADGTMSMCSCDLHHPFVTIGNVNEQNPIDVYNNEKMREIREIHLSGKKDTIDICRDCVMLYSREQKEVF